MSARSTLGRSLLLVAAGLPLAGCSVAYLPSERSGPDSSGAAAVTALPSACADGKAEGTVRNASATPVTADVVVTFAETPKEIVGRTTVQIGAKSQVAWTVEAPSAVSSPTCNVTVADVRDTTD